MHTDGEDPGGTAQIIFVEVKKGAISRALVIFHPGRQ
jgi:hypothetical protein